MHNRGGIINTTEQQETSQNETQSKNRKQQTSDQYPCSPGSALVPCLFVFTLHLGIDIQLKRVKAIKMRKTTAQTPEAQTTPNSPIQHKEYPNCSPQYLGSGGARGVQLTLELEAHSSESSL